MSHELMTTREVAAFLRISERKIYDLVAEGTIPCVRVTGKLLFPRRLIDRWLEQHSGQTTPPVPAHAPDLLVGSHDPLLDWAVRESGSGLATLFDGSLDGLERLSRGEALVAGLHVPEDDGKEPAWNVGLVRTALAGQPVVLLEWAKRRQGLIVHEESKASIRSLRDMSGRRVVVRQRQAGSALLFERLLHAAGLAQGDLRVVQPPARTESELARMIGDGEAEAGLGLQCMARVHGLGFVALIEERYDLALTRRAYFEPPFQRLLAFARSERFHARGEELGGYDLTGLGTVWFNAR